MRDKKPKKKESEAFTNAEGLNVRIRNQITGS